MGHKTGGVSGGRFMGRPPLVNVRRFKPPAVRTLADRRGLCTPGILFLLHVKLTSVTFFFLISGEVSKQIAVLDLLVIVVHVFMKI